MKIPVKTNCRNCVYMEVHVTDIRAERETKNDRERPVLRFKLNHVNTNDKKMVYVTKWDVILYSQGALSVGAWVKENMLVGVEGKLRTTKNNDKIIIAFHAERTDQIAVTLELNGSQDEETSDEIPEVEND